MGLELQHASNEDLSGLMAALPQWDLDPSSDAVDPKPWRVIWAYHPVMNTCGSGSRTCPQLSKFKTSEDLGTEIVSELPNGFDTYEPSVLIYPLYRIMAYHTVQSIRYKLANFLEHHLSQRELVPYFHDLKAHNRGPVPDVPQGIVDRIRQGDARALQVMRGHAQAYNSFELIKYCTKNGVPPPPAKPQGPPAKPSPPITDADFPALPKPSAAIPRRSPPTGRLTVPVSTAGRAQAPTPIVSKPPPALPKAPATSSASSADVSMEPPPEDQPDVHMATADTSEFSFLEMIRAGEATETTISTAPADLMDTPPLNSRMPPLTLPSTPPPPLIFAPLSTHLLVRILTSP